MKRSRLSTVVVNSIACLALALTGFSNPVRSVAASAAETPQFTAPQQLPLQPDALGGGSVNPASGGDFLVSTEVRPGSGAEIAVNTEDDQFLIIWAVWGMVFGQIYDAQGLPQGARVLVTLHGDRPAVAYSSASEEYLVVWTDSRDGGVAIYGQRLSASGELLDNPTTPAVETSPEVNFPIMIGPGVLDYPALAYNPLADEYLVVWQQDGGTMYEYMVYGKRVDADGYLLDNASTPGKNEHDPTIGFSIATGDFDPSYPEVVFNQDEEEYLVLFGELVNLWDRKIYAQLLDAAGVQLDNPYTGEDETSDDVHFLISEMQDTSGGTEAIKAVYNRSAGEYFIVWEKREVDGAKDVYGQRLSWQGALLDNPATAADESDPLVNYPLLVRDGVQSAPYPVYNPDKHEYLLAWVDEPDGSPSHQVSYAMRLDTLLQPIPPGEFALSESPDPTFSPAMAYNPSSHQYLVTWRDTGENSHISMLVAQRFWWAGLPLGHEFIVWAAEDDQEYPAVAYNSRDQEIMVAWSDWREGEPQVYYQRFDRYGLRIGDNTRHIVESHHQVQPTLAYSSIDNCYLLVWADDNNATIKGLFLNGHGTSIRTIFTIATGAAGTLFNPEVAYISDLQDNSFMVVYEAVTGTERMIYAYRVYPDGALSWRLPVRLVGNSSNPHLAYSADDNKLLVVWDYTYTAGLDTDLMGVTMDPDGTTGSPFWLSQAADSQSFPVLTWNPEDNQFLVVWQDYRDSGTQGADIFGQILDTSGVEVGPEILISNASGLSNQKFPHLDYAADQGAYRIVWQDDRDSLNGWDIRGNWVSRTGSVLHTIDDPITRMTGWQLYPALAYLPNYKRAFVAWQDGRDTEQYDIYGSFGAADAIPPVAHFTRDPIWGQAGDTFALNAWPSSDETTPRGALLVRWDLDDDGAWDTDLSIDKYITRTVMTPGVYSVKLGVWDRSLNFSSISLPIVVLGSTLALQEQSPDSPQVQPPTAVMTITPRIASAGATFNFDGSASTGNAALVARWDWENDGIPDTSFDSILTSTHVFTETGIHTVRLEVRDEGGAGLSQAVTQNLLVLPAALASLEVLPSGARFALGEEFKWRVRGLDIYDNLLFHPTAAWSMLDSQAGSIDASGVFTASVQAGVYPHAIQASNGVITDTATVVVFYPFNSFLPAMRR